MRLLILIIILLCSNISKSQYNVDLDKRVYWLEERSYATLSVEGDFGVTIQVFLLNKDTKNREKIIESLLKTKREKFFSINLLDKPTGNYTLEVYLDRDYNKKFNFIIIHKRSN